MSTSSSARRRCAHALLMGALAVGLGVTLWSGFHLAHDRGVASTPSTPSQSTQFHELLGFTAGAAMALHVALRWRWLVSVVPKLPRLRGPVRTSFILGTFLTLAVGLEVVSGALLGPGTAWQGLHHLSSKLVIAATVWHVVRHLPWLKVRLAPWAARRGGQNPVLDGGPSR